MFTQADFRLWLKENDNHLRQYTPDEIARLALLCGFPIEAVCGSVCDRVSHLKRLLEFWESPLADKWMRVK